MSHPLSQIARIALVASVFFIAAQPPARSQDPDRATPNAPANPQASIVGRASTLRLLSAANPWLWPLGVCSIVLATFALERAFALRRSRVIPRDFSDRFIDRLANGKLDRERALELARANESPVARVFQHALRYWGRPAAEIRVALDHDAAGEIADLKRNVRVLNGIATLAPLLGLLGTVIGMIESFDALSSRAAAGRSEALAHGISLALVATAFGLVIAAIAVVLYYFFLHRIDTLTRELDDKATRVIDLVSSDSGRPIADRRMGAADSLRPEARAYT